MKKGKPAIWTKAFPKQVQKPTAKVPKPKKAPRRIRTFSHRRQKLNGTYRTQAKEFVEGLNGVQCPVVLLVDELKDADWRITDVHHMRGRAGTLLLDRRFWLGVSRAGHDWIGTNMERARDLGFLCEKGLWNTPEPS